MIKNSYPESMIGKVKWEEAMTTQEHLFNRWLELSAQLSMASGLIQNRLIAGEGLERDLIETNQLVRKKIKELESTWTEIKDLVAKTLQEGYNG